MTNDNDVEIVGGKKALKERSRAFQLIALFV